VASHLRSDITPRERSCPVLLNVEGPSELQVSLIVIINELGHGGVVATAEHAGGSGLGLDCVVR
jgi:hypothetical protein